MFLFYRVASGLMAKCVTSCNVKAPVYNACGVLTLAFVWRGMLPCGGLQKGSEGASF